MTFLRVAVWLLALAFFFTSVAAGAEGVTYSGVPGKWKRSSKASKKTGEESEAQAQEGNKAGKNERSVTISIPEELLKPEKVQKKP